MEIQFCKIVEGEKDFIIIDHREFLCEGGISDDLAIGLCDRLHGIGAVAVLFVGKAVHFDGLSCRIVGDVLSFEALHAFSLFASAMGAEELSLQFSFESEWGDITVVLNEECHVRLSLPEGVSVQPACLGGDPEFIYSGVIDL